MGTAFDSEELAVNGTQVKTIAVGKTFSQLIARTIA